MGKRFCFPFLVFCCLLGAVVCSFGLWQEYSSYRSADVYYSNISQSKPQHDNIEKKECSSLVGKANGLNFARPNDLVAWLWNDDVSLDYPVMQGEDNVYYLNHLPSGEENKLGSIFLDHQVQPDFLSKVSVIYGHDVKDERMFGVLSEYREQEYYDEHPVINLSTMEHDNEILLLGAYLLDGDNDAYPEGFTNEKDFSQYLTYLSEKSFFNSSLTASFGDRLLILSTCAYDFDNARFAVVGVLREHEVCP